MNLANPQKMAVVVTIAIFFTLFDRLLKVFSLILLSDKGLVIISDILKLKLAKNFGIAFSIPLSGIFLNTLIVILILGLLFAIVNKLRNNRLTEVYGLVFVVLGAISNLFDRFRYGFVVDYLDLKYFTVFNFADIMIVGGIFFLIIYNIQNGINHDS